MSWKDYQVDVPIGIHGTAEVERRSISEAEAQFSMAYASIHGSKRYTPAGEYTGLLINGKLVMSDTRDEIQDIYCVFKAVSRGMSGKCLVNGLGLGVVVNGMLMQDRVTHVTVIESNKDVIALVGEHWKQRWKGQVEIINADAFTYKPPKGERFGYVWHDIWPDICADYLPQMQKLHRKYGRLSDAQGSWCRREVERAARQERRRAKIYG